MKTTPHTFLLLQVVPSLIVGGREEKKGSEKNSLAHKHTFVGTQSPKSIQNCFASVKEKYPTVAKQHTRCFATKFDYSLVAKERPRLIVVRSPYPCLDAHTSFFCFVRSCRFIALSSRFPLSFCPLLSSSCFT
jgi:hypothetical protein